MKTRFATAGVAILLSASPAMAQSIISQTTAAMGNAGAMERAQVQNQYRYNENEVERNKVRAQTQERVRNQDMFNRNLSGGNSSGRSGGSGGNSGGGSGGGSGNGGGGGGGRR